MLLKKVYQERVYSNKKISVILKQLGIPKEKFYKELHTVEHINNKLTYQEISNKYKIDLSWLNRNFKACGCRNNKVKGIDYTFFKEAFFDTWSDLVAYWLGFLAADGSISMNRDYISIHLNVRDKLHLIRFSKLLGLPEDTVKEELTTYKGTKIKSCRLGFSSKHMKNRLIYLGLEPGKSSKDINYLQYIPEEYKLSFIIGYFDGDGFYSNIEKENGYPSFGFVGTKSFLDNISDYLSKTYGLKYKMSCKSGNIYTLRWMGVEDVINFAKLYLDLGEEITLQRKQDLSKYILRGACFGKCCDCNNTIGRDAIRCNICNYKNQSKKHNSKGKPSKEILKEQIKSNTWVGLGRIYGVSDNAVRKWAKSYNLI